MRIEEEDLVSTFTFEHQRKRTRISSVLELALAFWASSASSYWMGRCLEASQLWIASFVLLLLAAIAAYACFRDLFQRKHIALLLVAILLGLSSGSAGAFSLQEQKESLGLDAQAKTVSGVVLLSEDARKGSYSSEAKGYLFAKEVGFVRVTLQAPQIDNGYFGSIFDCKVALNSVSETRIDSSWQQGIVCNAKVLSINETCSWSTPFAQMRAGFIQSVLSMNGDEEAKALLLALSSGYRGGLRNSSLYRDFQIAGLAHLVAVSGAHLSLVIAIIGVVFSNLKFAKKSRSYGSLIALFVFLFLCAFPLSAFRAAFMAALACFSFFAKRRSASQNALGLCVVIFLAFDPSVSLSESFALSALSTAGIILLAPWISQGINATPVRTPRSIRETVALTLAANLATMPLGAALFGQVSLISPFSNMVIAALFAPLCCVCICSQLLFCITGVVPLGLLAVGQTLCQLTCLLVGILARVPFAAIPCNQTLVGGLALSFVLIGMLLAWHAFGNKKQLIKLIKSTPITIVIALCSIFIVGVALYLQFNTETNDVTLKALDVGQGDALLIKDGDVAVLVDTGNQDVALKKKLGAEGITHLDGVFISHPDDDHSGSLEQLLRVVQVEAVYVAQDLLVCPCWKCADVRTVVYEAGVPLVGVEVGDSLSLVRSCIKVLWPQKYKEEGGNQDSLCLCLEIDVDNDKSCDYKALLVGDAEAETLEAMASLKLLPKADVLKVGHHGSKSSCSEKSLSIINPTIALVSVGADNRYGHPTVTALQALESQSARWYRTDQEGTISCIFQKQGIRVQTER